MNALATRVAQARGHTIGIGPGRGDRPLALGLVRRILPVRPAARGVPHASPRRPTQRPPAGDWRVWAYVAGRGAGKTRAGACWIQHGSRPAP